MSILSPVFSIALVLVVFVYWAVPAKARRLVLFVASYGFYATFHFAYPALLLAATAGVYAAGLRLAPDAPEPAKRRAFWLALPSLLALLFAFKLGDAALPAASAWRWLLPIGLSYYAFKLISYLLDVYWEKYEPERDFWSFAVYVAFFPQLLSGPIQRANDFLKQLHARKALDADQFQRGARLILLGCFKKLVVADRLAEIVDRAYAQPRSAGDLALILASYLYVFQLYTDLSGFTDIAIGLGRLFGLEAPQNFDRPFQAANVQQFWRRWHMTLTSWLTDYLFTPLRLRLRTIGTIGLSIAIVVNMVAIGLWHGLKVTYLLFGLLHGLFMIVSVLTLKRRDTFFKAHPSWSRLRRFTAPLITFHLVVIGMVLARAHALGDALYVYRRAAWLLLHPRALVAAPHDLGALGLGEGRALVFVWMLALAFVEQLRGWLAARHVVIRWSLYYAAIGIIFFFGVPRAARFIYAQF